jgi:hypothetical protein
MDARFRRRLGIVLLAIAVVTPAASGAAGPRLESLDMTIAAGPNGVPPTNTFPPTVTGVANVGASLTGAKGSWSGSKPMPHTYRWLSGPRPELGSMFHCAWLEYTDSQREAIFDSLEAAGVEWVRIDVGWSSLQETGRGQFSQWYVALVDKCVGMAAARGLNVLGMLFRTPGWANGGQGVQVPPTNVADYAFIANWVANRYRGRVQAWEIWNEPDPAQASWSWSGTVQQYVQLLKAAYPAVKSGDPNALVVFGGPSSNDDAFIASAYAAGARGAFDVMATHPYQGLADAPPEQPDDGNRWWFTHLPAVRAVMVANGDAAKPIWFTEFGWSSHDNWPGIENWNRGVTEVQQAEYLVRAVNYTRANYPYVANMLWYTERNRSAGKVHYDNYGLLRASLAAKPAYASLKSYIASG